MREQPSDVVVPPRFVRRDGGAVTVTALHEGVLHASFDLLVGTDPETAVRRLRDAQRPVEPDVPVTVYAVQTAGRLAVIDAGMGSTSVLGGLAESMAVAGLDPDRVDTVLLSHLHPDHANGLLDGDFRNARIFAPDAEVEFVSDIAAMANAPDYVRRDYTAAPEVLHHIRDRLFSLEKSLDVPGVTTIPLPGHSPGHTGFVIETGIEQVLVVGDLLHFAHLQTLRPELSLVADIDPEQASATRRLILADAAEAGTLLAGAHLGTAGFYRLEASGEGYTLRADDSHQGTSPASKIEA